MPTVVLVNPKFPHNVGAALRACSCWGADSLLYTGHRVSMEASEGYRLPREERMKGYKTVDFKQVERPWDLLPKGVVPIAIEVSPNAEVLSEFVHPENAAYFFGPEDGGLGRMELGLCHRFVIIPTAHCLNLAAAVNIVLYDRLLKGIQQGKIAAPSPETVLSESRGFIANS